MLRFPVLFALACFVRLQAAPSTHPLVNNFPGSSFSAPGQRWHANARIFYAAFLLLAGLAIPGLSQTATPAATFLSFNAAQIGVSGGTAQTLTASFAVSGYAGSFTPTATLHYGHDYTLGAVSCSGGGPESCTVPVTFEPTLPGTRKDAIFLMNGTTRLATVLLNGVGQGPMSLVQPGAFTTSVPSSSINMSGYDYLYQSVTDENGTVYILPSGNADFIVSVTKAGVATLIPLTKPPYFWSIGIDGAGVIYIFGESRSVTTWDTVLGIQGTYLIPDSQDGTNWYPGAVDGGGNVFVVDPISNNGKVFEFKPNGSAAFADVLTPAVVQPDTLAVDSAGDVFVGGYTINEISAAGVQTQVNMVGAGDGLAVDAADTLYATRYIPLNEPSQGVAMLPASNYTTPIASIDGSQEPLGASLGSDGKVFVSNYVNLDIFDRSTTETIDFGEVSAGSSKTDSTASVYNGGNQPLTISEFTLSTLSDSGFSLDFSSANECTIGVVLAPGALCQASVVFAPTHPGTFSGTISITSNSLNGANTAQSIQLTGTSYGSYDVLSPNPLAFPSQAQGTSQTLPVTLTNEGNYYPSTVYSVKTDNSAFTIAEGTCTSVTVQVGATCQLQVTFSPVSAQAYTGTATIDTFVNGTSQAHQIITLSLSGTGTGPVTATPVINPGTGTYSSSQQVTMTDATANATIYYTIDGSAPTSASTKYTGAITVSSNETLNAIATAASLSQSATASATYTFAYPAVLFTPASMAFGNQTVNTTSGVQAVTLTNSGAATLTIGSISITGANASSFAQTNNCGATLAAGAGCNIALTFAPTTVASFSAVVAVTDNANGSPQTVALSGSGTAAPAPVAVLTPSSLSFTGAAGTTSAAQTVTLSNTGSVPLTITGITAPSSPLMGLFNETSNCGASLAAGSSCTISVTFSPAIAGNVTGNLLVTDNATGSPQMVTLTGTGVNPPGPTFTPSTLAFGNQVVTTTSAPLAATLNNTGADTLVIDGGLPTILGAGAASISATTNCPSSLAPAATCSVSAVFTPSSLGAYSLSIQMMAHYSSAPSIELKPTVALTGTGINPPPPTFSPASLAFGNQVAGSTSASQTMTLTNPASSLPIKIESLVFASATKSFNQTNNCPATLAAGSSCQIQISFAPTSAGAISDGLLLNYVEDGQANFVLAALTGTGINPSPPVFTPASLAFGNQVAGSMSASQTITLTNPASAAQPIIFESLVFASATKSFNQKNNCPETLPAGSSCQIQISFAPISAGAISDKLLLNYVEDGQANFVLAALTGTGINPPQPAFSPASLAFGNQGLGLTSAPQTVTLTNPAGADQPIIIESLVFASATNSFNQTNNCPASLAAGSSCQIQISFTPGSAGAISDSLLLNYVEDGQANFVLAALNGTGIAPVASLAPASMSFTTTAGTTSAPQTATLTNTGVTPLSILNITVTGASPNDYQQINNCGLLLAAGANCTISVTFTPGFPGSYPATLTVSDNDPASPQNISLTGNGINTPDFVVASSTPSQTIPPGGSAQFSISVSAQNGATIPAVTLSATGLPPGATASFSQSAITPGSTSATTTLTIHTQQTLAGNKRSMPAWPNSALPALALLGLFFVPRKQRRRWTALGLLLFASLAGVAALTGCGGGFSLIPPAKTYTVTVTASIGSIQQTTTVQLTVQ